jgi:N-methylhydantoinase B
METLTDAVRLAFEQAAPAKVCASWGHTNGCNIAGWDSRTDEEYVTMVLATLISGAGATPQQDGWHACGPQSCFGALTSGDVELLEYSYPIIIHRYSLMTDSGGAGKFRGGSGTCWEVEPIDEAMTFVMFGEGRRLPAMGAANARSAMIDSKVGRVEFTRGGEVEVVRKNVIATIKPGETAANMNPGGGGYGECLIAADEIRPGLVLEVLGFEVVVLDVLAGHAAVIEAFLLAEPGLGRLGRRCAARLWTERRLALGPGGENQKNETGDRDPCVVSSSQDCSPYRSPSP